MAPGFQIVKIWVIVLTISACSHSLDASVNSASSLDPVFREIYRALGGEDLFGPPISPVLLQGSIQSQYTMSALLIHDAHAPEGRLFQFAPLGKEMGIVEPHVPQPPQDYTGLYINHHIIPAEFVPLYEQLRGEHFVGLPLTEMRYNPIRKRYEQYFENLGFYRLEEDPPGNVNLLAYGARMCKVDCSGTPSKSSQVDLFPLVHSPFLPYNILLTPSVTGFALTDVYALPDGSIEQIFENVVIATDPNQPDKPHLRPIVKSLNILDGQMATAINDSGYRFYPIEGDKGYNIPAPIWDFIEEHGGFDVSGPPVTPVTEQSGEEFRQCFTNLCLIYDPSQPPALQVRGEPLGYIYKEVYYEPSTGENAKVGSQAAEVTISAWEKYPALSDNQMQEIFVKLSNGREPLVNVQPYLEITLPDGRNQSLTFPPTDAQGQSMIELPILKARTYTLIPYKVCYQSFDDRPRCRQDTFLILSES